MSSFLGFAGYYRGFIPKYSALTNRMNSMKKAEKFEWSEDMEKDFLELKSEFTVYIQHSERQQLGLERRFFKYSEIQGEREKMAN